MAGAITAELTTIGALLRRPSVLAVPIYQRNFSWTRNEVEQLWLDILETVRGHRPDHFMGAVVVNDSEEHSAKVIDGQQRLATISLLLAGIRDRLLAHGDSHRAQMLQTTFLGSPEIRTLSTNPKLELNETNNDFYQRWIFTRTIPVSQEEAETMRSSVAQAGKKQGIHASNRLLVDAYNILYDLFDAYVAEFGDAADAVGDFIEALDSKLQVIFISVQDDSNAYLIFETLNDRGLALSVSDLLKNYVFSKAGASLTQVKKAWDECNRHLGSAELTTYIRHYWLSNNGVVREKDLYRAIAGRWRSPSEVVKFMNSLCSSAEIYGAFDEPDHEIWDTFPADKKQLISMEVEQLALFRVVQCNPVLLAAVEMLKDNTTVVEVFRLMKVFTFRYSIICGYGTGNLERAYCDAAKLMRENPQTTVDDIFGKLAHLYPSDDVFKTFFETKGIRSGPLARYILRTINDGGYQVGALITNPNWTQLNLEHVLPKKLTDEWIGGFSDEQDPAEYVHRLGNLALLDPQSNKKASNSSFIEKRDQVFGEGFQPEITKQLCDYSTWGPEQIETRQTAFAEKAVGIWRYK